MKNCELIAIAMAENDVHEVCHTYQHWKKLGYQVQKGEKALFKCSIWKHTSKKDKETGDEETHMFMKTANFFGASQVKPIEKK